MCIVFMIVFGFIMESFEFVFDIDVVADTGVVGKISSTELSAQNIVFSLG